jgi:hypothetical protein
MTIAAKTSNVIVVTSNATLVLFALNLSHKVDGGAEDEGGRGGAGDVEAAVLSLSSISI